jgi:prophage regulatory protein
MSFLSYDALVGRGIDLSKTTLWRLERDGKFPKRVRVSPGRVAWVADEIDAYLAERVADRAHAA